MKIHEYQAKGTAARRASMPVPLKRHGARSGGNRPETQWRGGQVRPIHAPAAWQGGGDPARASIGGSDVSLYLAFCRVNVAQDHRPAPR